jgi:hypothetical protein
MYRYIVDSAITYTSEDFILYRESPFACWMERLTLENPDHGIPADTDSEPRSGDVERQDDLAETLRDEGRDVVLVDWEMDEPQRRSATLEAMRRGADFVVNGQLALGPLSGPANLLMRTSGYSDLGDYLYVPCDTQGKTTLHSAFRLCFLADLLHMLQGQLPPQMLIIRGGSNVVPLATDDHIYHYRAVKHRFMTAMREFRKHRMPDPAESAHFGRWSDCAREVLKQRALHAGDDRESEQSVAADEPLLAAAEGDVTGLYPPAEPSAPPVMSVAADTRRAGELQVRPTAGGTLAEQASQLAGTGYARAVRRAPGHTPNLAPVMAAREAERHRADSSPGGLGTGAGRDLADVTLDNLEFIGSKLRPPTQGTDGSTLTAGLPTERAVASPGIAEPAEEALPPYTFPEQGAALDLQRRSPAGRDEQVPQGEDIPVLVEAPVELPATRREKRHPLDSLQEPVEAAPASVIDRDDTASPAPLPEPRVPRRAPRFSWEALEAEGPEQDFPYDLEEEEGRESAGVFSDSLITNGSYEERD